MNVFDHLFETSRNLDKDFVLGSNEKISFNDLYNNSLKIASYLIEQLGEGKNIILISQNSVLFISVYLGILKSGNVCIPLNYSIEQDNLDYILKTTVSPVCFISKQVYSKLKFSNNIDIINEDVYSQIIKNQSIIDFKSAYNRNSIAEIIFTSGSTGVPKGVMISHKNIIANTNSIIEYLNLSSNDIMCVVLPFFYCYGLSLLHTHLRVGGSIVLNNNFIFLGTVINDLKNYNCTGFAGVPSHFQILLKKSKTFKFTLFPDLKYVTQAGGKLHNVFIEEFIEAFPKIEFYVMYGQTEATARLTYLPPKLVRKKLGSIGRAIPDVEIKVVDKKGNQVSVGIEGELIAKGDNTMAGYFKDLGETKKIVKAGWLYTGDIAKVDEEGFLYLVARKKEIIKVGGKRVSPKEIEEVILTVPNVIDCTIQGVNDEILGEAIKATVVVTQINDPDELRAIIQKKCKEKLSIFKIPKIIELKDKINFKSTGKK